MKKDSGKSDVKRVVPFLRKHGIWGESCIHETWGSSLGKWSMVVRGAMAIVR